MLADQATPACLSFLASSTVSPSIFKNPSASTARMRTVYCGSERANSARAAAADLSPRMPRARAAMARTKTSLSLSAACSDFRSAALMISYSSARRSFQPLSKFSSLGGNSSLRYFSSGDTGACVQPTGGRTRRQADARIIRFMVLSPSRPPRLDRPEQDVVIVLEGAANRNRWWRARQLAGGKAEGSLHVQD